MARRRLFGSTDDPQGEAQLWSYWSDEAIGRSSHWAAPRFENSAVPRWNDSITTAATDSSAEAVGVDATASAGPASEGIATVGNTASAAGSSAASTDQHPDLLTDPFPEDDLLAQLQQAATLMRLTEVRTSSLYAGVDGHGQTVVILDTGIDLDHPYFGPDADANGIADRILYQYDFYGANDSNASDAHGHGTHVAGIVGSQNATYPGMAPGANFIILKVLSNGGSGNFFDIEEAFQWVVANRNAYNIVAVSMSIGDSANVNSNQSNVLTDEVQTLWNSGIATIIAAGNSYASYNAPGVNGLAATPLAWGVASTLDNANTFSSFSQRSNTMTEIAAPGSNITSAYLNGGIATMSGTSMATPMISGLVALAQDLSQEVTGGTRLAPATILNLMRMTGVNITDGTTSVPRVDALNLLNGIVSYWQQSTGNADNIYGWRGADILSGQGGDDTIDGGAGTDSAVFSGLRSAYTVANLGNGSFSVSGPDGIDVLTGVEFLVFGDMTIPSPLYVNAPPVITSNSGGDTATVSVAENATAVTTVIASDPDSGTTLTYSLSGGADQARFQINTSTGALSFITAPNFEAPTDADGNNSYVVQVRAFDGSLFDDQILTVSVANVNEMDSAWINGGFHGDYNGDGRADILFRHGDGSIALWQTNAAGQFSSAQPLGSAANVWRIDAIGDFNGNGRDDILFRHDNGSIAVWQTDANGQLASAQVLGSAARPWRVDGVGDFDGNGWDDILFRHDNGSIAAWTTDTNGQSASAQALGSVSTAWNIVGVGDFDGNGRSDILFRNDNGSIAAWQTNANGQLTSAQPLGSTGTEWHVFGIGDFDGNGRSDILFRNDGNTIGVWQTDTSGQLSSTTTIGTTSSDWHIAGTGDFDDDGRTDILFRNDNGSIASWQTNTAPQVLGSLSNNWSIGVHLFDLV